MQPLKQTLTYYQDIFKTEVDYIAVNFACSALSFFIKPLLVSLLEKHPWFLDVYKEYLILDQPRCDQLRVPSKQCFNIIKIHV